MCTGIVVTTPAPRLQVGQRATLGCSSDLDPTGIHWYENDTAIFSIGGSMSLSPVSTDDENKVFKCLVSSRYGSQERAIRIMTHGNYHD